MSAHGPRPGFVAGARTPARSPIRPGRAQAARGGPWLCRMRPPGLLAVVVPSALRLMVQPHRWIRIRWWNEHSRTQLRQAGGSALTAGDDVVDVAGGGRVSQPGAAQCRSRAVIARRRCGGTMLGDRADVQGQADRPGGCGEFPGAEPRREPAGPGQQGDGLPQDDRPGRRPWIVPAVPAADPVGVGRSPASWPLAGSPRCRARRRRAAIVLAGARVPVAGSSPARYRPAGQPAGRGGRGRPGR